MPSRTTPGTRPESAAEKALEQLENVIQDGTDDEVLQAQRNAICELDKIRDQVPEAGEIADEIRAEMNIHNRKS